MGWAYFADAEAGGGVDVGVGVPSNTISLYHHQDAKFGSPRILGK